MNLVGMQAECRARARDLSNIEVSNQDWADYLNDGYLFVAGASPEWPFTEGRSPALVVTPPANDVALPTDVLKVLAVHNVTDKLPMYELTGTVTPYSLYPERGATTGTPQHYRLHGNKIELWPYPAVATTILVEYRAAPDPLSASTDIPIFPSQYHRALIHYAMEQALLESDPDRAEREAGRFNRILEQMKTDLLGARGDSYPQIADVGWF